MRTDANSCIGTEGNLSLVSGWSVVAEAISGALPSSRALDFGEALMLASIEIVHKTVC